MPSRYPAASFRTIQPFLLNTHVTGWTSIRLLKFEGIPAGAKSLAPIVDDPDARGAWIPG
ncbi:MAG: hypothetical protein ACLPN1_08955 [Dissulfurispiraceae bacterium]